VSAREDLRRAIADYLARLYPGTSWLPVRGPLADPPAQTSLVDEEPESAAMIEKYYTGRELAELLSLDYETVLKKAQTGEIPSIRVGRLRRFPESAVQTWLEQQRMQRREL
jgi:excisionase family DNA binding protein